MDVLIVEDKPNLARHYYNNLNGDAIGEVVGIASTAAEAKKYISGENPPSKYIIDIDLGNMSERGGIEVMKTIKEKTPDALVMPYTAYDLEEACDLVGLRNYRFFFKSPGKESIAKDFKTFRDLIQMHSVRTNKKIPDSLTTYYAQIAHIQPDVKNSQVKLFCHHRGHQIEKIIKAEPVREALQEDFGINKWVKVVISETGPEIKITFHKPGVIPLEIDNKIASGFTDEEYMNSRIWGREEKKGD